MTIQEMQFDKMHSILATNMKDPNSTFQKLLKNTPEALVHLFDRCLIYNGNEAQDRIYLDCFLFKTSDQLWESELSITNIPLFRGTNQLLEHALFEMFVQLKWMKVKKFFTLGIVFHFFYMLLVLGFTLVNFSTILKNTVLDQKHYWRFALTVGNVILSLAQFLKIMNLFTKVFKKISRSLKMYSCEKLAAFYEFLSILASSAIPVSSFFVLSSMSRPMTACFVLYTGWHFLLTSPTMTSQVMRTIAGLALAYSPQILSFALAFHILLPDSVAFG